MPPREHYEFVVLRMVYASYIDPCYPRISVTRKKQTPSASHIEVRNWFDLAMVRERSQLPLRAKVRYTEWRIVSGNAKLFKIDGFCYDRIIVFLGEETTYWMFYEDAERLRRIEGKGGLPLTYCGCCFSNQYISVIQSIKNSLSKKQ